MISEKDFNLLRVSDKPEEVAQTVQNWYLKQEIMGKKALAQLS
jgi:predicted Rossmann-fold nucleotide-binding protein